MTSSTVPRVLASRMPSPEEGAPPEPLLITASSTIMAPSTRKALPQLPGSKIRAKRFPVLAVPVMSPPPRDAYIPVGSLGLDNETELFDMVFREQCERNHRWRTFFFPREVSDKIKGDIYMLLCHSRLYPFYHLFYQHWIFFEVCFDKVKDQAICRVYVLPDDVERRAVPRDDIKRRQEMQQLLRELNYSKALWDGKVACSRDPFHGEVNGESLLSSESSNKLDGDQDEHAESLLHMFNTIPSPEPQPDAISDPEFQRAWDGLMTSNILGLKTKLYSYQCRSAALMLQREVAPGRIVDPRLAPAVDQNGNAYFRDEIDGSVRREAVYCDGISGGILAEEMGTGKTLICLALILATKHFPADIPDGHEPRDNIRPHVGSLMEMVAAHINKVGAPWSLYLDEEKAPRRCVEVLKENRAYYYPTLHMRDNPRKNSLRVLPRQSLWAGDQSALRPHGEPDDWKIFLSRCTLVLVPTNLVKQWQQEIAKHTEGLNVLVVPERWYQPTVEVLLQYDIILCPISRFERLRNYHKPCVDCPGGWHLDCPMSTMRFKRVIIDEGHRIGNARIRSAKSDLVLLLETLHISARWIVTGTPSTGLYGEGSTDSNKSVDNISELDEGRRAKVGYKGEVNDLERLGAMAKHFLRAKPWATPENDKNLHMWRAYVMQPQHKHGRNEGRKECLRSVLDSLIIRHRRSDIGGLLPAVEEKTVVLDGCYLDKLSLNIFAMMIIFNAVQSQRTDADYFFHPQSRRALNELVGNMQQSSFFGGYFFGGNEISSAIERAEIFLEEKKIPISAEDDRLLRAAISLGHQAATNHLRPLADVFQEVPILIEDFPGGPTGRKAWSLDEEDGDLTCTSARLLRSLQDYLRPGTNSPGEMMKLLGGDHFVEQGETSRNNSQAFRDPAQGVRSGYAGRKALGSKLDDMSGPLQQQNTILSGAELERQQDDALFLLSENDITAPLLDARIVATASAKLTYLIDAILKYQGEEQIIVFYDNENTAYYLAEHLEVLHVEHLIYAKGITATRRAQYVDTFNHNLKFRVLIMDISQAAFGLNLQTASRIFFINPPMNLQIETQAIARARRISQKSVVRVETLVLRGSLEELIVERRRKLSQAEMSSYRSILDDRPMYDWIRSARIITDLAPPPGGDIAQMAPLATPQPLFGRRFGTVARGEDGLVRDTADGGRLGAAAAEGLAPAGPVASSAGSVGLGGLKRRAASDHLEGPVKKAKTTAGKRVAFALPEDESSPGRDGRDG